MKLLHIPSAVIPKSPLPIPSFKILRRRISTTTGPNVPDLNLKQTGLRVLIHVHVDWEMCVDVSHLVLEALGDTNDQVVDESSDSSEGSNVLSRAVVEFDVDDILLWVGEVDSQVVQVLRELA